MKPFRAVGAFATWTVISQVAILTAGILVVRALPKDEYALYSICLASLGVVTVLSTSGITSTLIALAGERLSKNRDVGSLFRAAFDLRWRIILFVFVPVITYTGVVLSANGATWWQVTIMLSLIGATLMPTLSASFARLPLQLRGKFSQVQWIALSVAILRLLLTVVTVTLALNYGAVYLLIGVIVAAADAIVTTRLARRQVKWDASVKPEGRGDLTAAVWRTLPGNLAVILGEMLVTAALTWNGNTDAIAEIAAFSRFAAAFVVINTLASNIVSPHIARSAHTRSAVARALLLAGGAYFAASCLFALGSWLLSDLLLWLLGAQYAGMNFEFTLVAIACAITNFSVYGLGAVTYARGWNRLNWVYIPLVLIWAVLGLTTLDLASPVGAILFFLGLSLVRLVNQAVRLTYGFSQLSR